MFTEKQTVKQTAVKTLPCRKWRKYKTPNYGVRLPMARNKRTDW